MQVGDIMATDVKAVSVQDTFERAASALHENRISSLIVKDGEDVAGIVTERDVVNIVAEGLDPKAVRVGERMTRDLASVDPKTDIAHAAELMKERAIRHLPVIDRGKLVGIISIRDLLSWAVQEITGGHELPDLERSQAALSAAVEVTREE